MEVREGIVQVPGLGNADSRHMPEQSEAYTLACHCLIYLMRLHKTTQWAHLFPVESTKPANRRVLCYEP